MPTNNKNKLRWSLLAFALLVVAAAWYFDLLGFLTVENFKQYRQELGLWAPLVFVLAFVIGELLQIPSVLWIFFAGVIWPWWIALPTSLVAALLAATGAFLVARYFLGDRVIAKLPPALQDLNDRLSHQPTTAVVLLRLTTFLHPAIHWVLAASSVRLPAFLLGTFIGILPMTLALVLLGDVFMSWWDDYSLVIMTATVSALLLYIVLQRRKQAS